MKMDHEVAGDKSYDPEEILSPKEVSKWLKVCNSWGSVMARRGVLPYYKLGKSIRFKRGDILRFLEERRKER